MRGWTVSKTHSADRDKNARKKRKSEADAVMSPSSFKRWRKSLKLSQKEAANALGLKRRAVQYYEKGERNGESLKIPKAVRLACFAITQGCDDYEGPAEPVPVPDDAAPSDEAGTDSKPASS